MSRQQKKNVFSLIFFYGFILFFNIGLLLFIFPTIFVDKSKVGIYYFFAMISLVLAAIFLSILQLIDGRFHKIRKFIPPLPITYGYKGVPNNKFKEFFVPKELIKDEMLFVEIRKNVFEYKVGDKSFVFDMNGWVKRITYITWLILSELQIFYTRGNRKLISKSIYVMHENLRLSFALMNDKKITKTIVKKYKTKLPLLLKIDLKTKISIISSSKISITSLYDFNYD